MTWTEANLGQIDPDLDAAIRGEQQRQEDYLELIASENYVSPAVMAAQGSCLTNKYADGYPGARTYRGCEFVDAAESLARDRACRLFGAAYANVQPYSGTQANAAAYAALMEHGDCLLGMSADHGGHITHGNEVSFAGRAYAATHYGVDPNTGEINYDEVEDLALEHRPKVIVAGFSAYPRIIDWDRFRAIADRVGAYLLADMAHAAGLVAAGLYPSPVDIADVCTTTTHKTLRGPRGGMIVARANTELAERLDRAVYPTTQGGPLMHVVAAKAIALLEATRPEFVEYQRRVLANASALAARLIERGIDVVSGGTDNHMVIVRLRGGLVDAQQAEQALEAAHIAVGSVSLPSDSGDGGGLRIGTPAATTRGLGVDEILAVADWIAQIIVEGAEPVASVRDEVRALCREFPVYSI